MARVSYETHIQPKLKEIAVLREAGISHDSIAEMLKVGRSFYYKHKALVDEFVDATKNGDAELVKSGRVALRKLVDGYTRKKITNKYIYIDGVKTLVETNEIIEEIGPEPSSVYFALVNKTNGEFRHRDKDDSFEGHDDVEPTMIERLENESD